MIINKSNNNYIIIWNEFGTLTFHALVDLSLARTPRVESRAPVLRAKSNRTSTYTTNQLVGSLRKQIKINSDLSIAPITSQNVALPYLGRIESSRYGPSFPMSKQEIDEVEQNDASQTDSRTEKMST